MEKRGGAFILAWVEYEETVNEYGQPATLPTAERWNAYRYGEGERDEVLSHVQEVFDAMRGRTMVYTASVAEVISSTDYF